jgi:multiple sugar transport system ATP-binding protein
MGRIVIENITKEFAGPHGERIRAVKELSLTVEDGQLLVIVGPSGCGKTTTLRLIAGLERPDRGTILIDGQSLDGVPAGKRDVAMVFQNQSLFPHLTVFQNLALGLVLRKLPGAQIEERVREAARMLDLTALLQRRPAALSGGECQRVALGRALARKPRVFLLDEPLSNLDAPMRLQLRGEIARLRRRLAATMILVTHDQAEAMAMADTVAVMNQGRLEQVAPPQEVYCRPANRFVAGFIGSPPMNFFEGLLAQNNGRLCFQERTLKDAGFSVLLDELPSDGLRHYLGKPITMGLRPEHLLQAKRGDGRTPVEAVLERVEPAGAESLHYYSSVNHCFVARAPAGTGAVAGQRAMLAFETSRALFFDPATGLALGAQVPGAAGAAADGMIGTS